MTCRLFGDNLLSETVMVYFQLQPILMNFCLKSVSFHSGKCIWKCRLQNWRPSLSRPQCADIFKVFFGNASLAHMIAPLSVKYPWSIPVTSTMLPGLNNNKARQLAKVALYIDGLVQDCSISSALALEILQSCIKPSIWLCENLPTPYYMILYDMSRLITIRPSSGILQDCYHLITAGLVLCVTLS